MSPDDRLDLLKSIARGVQPKCRSELLTDLQRFGFVYNDVGAAGYFPTERGRAWLLAELAAA